MGMIDRKKPLPKIVHTINPRKLGWKAKTAIGLSAVALAGLVRHGNLRRVSRMQREVEVAARFEKSLPSKKRIPNVNEWVKISNIYKLNPVNPKHEQWMRTVNSLGQKLSLSPQRIIRTFARSSFSENGGEARKNAIAGNQRMIDKISKQKDSKGTRIRIENMRREIKRLQNIAAIGDAVVKNPTLASLRQHVIDAKAASRLESAFGM